MSLKQFLMASLAIIATVATADTVKFKDGTSWTGEIISQDSTQVVMSVELSGGKITTQRTANRAEVTEIILSTAEEKLTKQAEAAYRKAVKYQLDPQTSYSKDYYDKIISTVFDNFLVSYTNSVRVAEIEKLRGQWIADRDQVVAGNMKFHGEWKPVSEVMPLLEAEQSQKVLAEGRSLMTQGKLDDAIHRLTPLTFTNRSGVVVEEATTLLAEAYKLLVPQLQQRLQQIQAELPRAKEAMDKAKQDLQNAQQSMNRIMGKGSQLGSWDTGGGIRRTDQYGQGRYNQPGDYRRGSTTTEPEKKLGAMSSATIAAQTTLNDAKKNYASIESAYAQLQAEAQTLHGKIAATSASMTRLDIQLPSAKTQQVAQVTPPPSEPKEEDVTTGMWGWFKKNWLFVLVGAGVILYLMNRFAKN